MVFVSNTAHFLYIKLDICQFGVPLSEALCIDVIHHLKLASDTRLSGPSPRQHRHFNSKRFPGSQTRDLDRARSYQTRYVFSRLINAYYLGSLGLTIAMPLLHPHRYLSIIWYIYHSDVVY